MATDIDRTAQGLKQVKTACPLDCWDTCSIIAHVEGDTVVKLEGDASHPVTQGFLCTKGRRLRDRRESSSRLLYPLKRVEGTLVRISWEQALDEIAEKLRQVLDTDGHQAILHAYDWGSGTVLKNLNQRFFYKLGGCTETVGSLCWEAGLTAQRYDFGQARSHAPEDILNAKSIVIWGRNVAVTNIHMTPFLKQAQANGAQLVIVNPLPTDLDARATLVIHPRPGTDALLAMGVLKVCVKRGWLDENFLLRHSVGWEEYVQHLNGLSWDNICEKTDVSYDELVRLAQVYGRGTIDVGEPTATLLGLGMQRYPGGGNTIRAIDALVAATGHIGVSGGGVNYANRLIPSFLDEEALAERSGSDVREFSRGGQAAEILQASVPIRLMIVTRNNPVVQVPDTAKLLEAYASIDCKVVIDNWLTPTAELADYVLPCTNVLEEEDFVFSTMWHGYVTYINRAVTPRGEAKTDYEIFAALAERLGIGSEFRKTPEDWMQLALAPMEAYGVTFDDLKREGTIRLPVPDVPYADYQFLTPSGKFEFVSEVAAREGQSPHARYIPRTSETAAAKDLRGTAQSVRPDTSEIGYPYALLTIHPRVSENSQHKDYPELPAYPVAEISERIANERGLTDGELATLWNDQAEIVVKVRVQTAGGHPYTIKLEQGWWGQGKTINHLTTTTRADFGIQTAQYDATCDLKRFS